MKIIVIEDETLIRNLLVKVAVDEFGYTIVGEASDGVTGLELCQKLEPEFLLLDLFIPKLDGFTLAERVLKENPNIRILTLSSECDEFTLYRVFNSGVHGYVDKLSQTPQILKEAIEYVASGKPYYSKLARSIRKELSNPSSFARILSPREIEVLPYIAQGLPNESIAQQFEISPYTVRNHRNNIFAKLNLTGTRELMKFAIEKGIWKHKSSVDGYL